MIRRDTVPPFVPPSERAIGPIPLLAAILAALLVSACATAPAPPGGGERESVEQRVRAPSAGGDEALQVYAVRNPAVVSLARQAEAAETEGDTARAEMLLERALRIDGRDPAVLQQMAELQLARGHADQALSYARRARELGPDVGSLCQRTLRTLELAHERLGDWDEAWQARERIDDCIVEPPERF